MSRENPSAIRQCRSHEELDGYEWAAKQFGLTTEQARLIDEQRKAVGARKK